MFVTLDLKSRAPPIFKAMSFGIIEENQLYAFGFEIDYTYVSLSTSTLHSHNINFH